MSPHYLMLAMLSTIGMAGAQVTCTKHCIAYFYCPLNSTVPGTCSDYSNVCCDLDGLGADSRIPPPSTPAPASQCGFRNQPKTVPGDILNYKIVADSPDTTRTYFGEFPWMVAVLHKTGEEFLCGGSLIYPNIILTTAHTVSKYTAADLKVNAGVWNTTEFVSEFPRHQFEVVKEVIIHPEFDRAQVRNDIALLVLEQPFKITDNVATICLPSDQMPYNQSTCVATGWGVGSFGASSEGSVLKKVNVPLMNFELCQSRLRETKLGYGFNLHRSFLCADGTKGDTCKGDGGGPLMCSTMADPNQYVQIGITSWGVGDCGKAPSVYTSTTVLQEWINKKVNALNSS